MPKAVPIFTSTRRMTLVAVAAAVAASLPEPARSAAVADAELLGLTDEFAGLESRLDTLLAADTFDQVKAREAEIDAVSDQQAVLAERAILIPCHSVEGLRAKAVIADAYRPVDNDHGDCLADRVRSAVVRDLLAWSQVEDLSA